MMNKRNYLYALTFFALLPYTMVCMDQLVRNPSRQLEKDKIFNTLLNDIKSLKTINGPSHHFVNQIETQLNTTNQHLLKDVFSLKKFIEGFQVSLIELVQKEVNSPINTNIFSSSRVVRMFPATVFTSMLLWGIYMQEASYPNVDEPAWSSCNDRSMYIVLTSMAWFALHGFYNAFENIPEENRRSHMCRVLCLLEEKKKSLEKQE